MGRADYLKLGDYNALCDVCGFKFKASELKDRWDGAKVCASDWEPKHPSDMFRMPVTEGSVPWSRPEPETVEVSVTYGNQGTQDNTVPTGTFTTFIS